MKNKVYTNKNTQAELERELKHDEIVDRELNDTQDYLRMEVLMDKIERMRQEHGYSQKKLAEKAGIGLSTYKDYLSGFSNNIKLKTVLNIAQIFQCKPSDLIEDIEEEH